MSEKTTDKELLELAAKSAGIKKHENGQFYYDDIGLVEWCPLTNDGDAFRLAVKLRLDINRPSQNYKSVCVWVDHKSDYIEEPHGKDAYAATRRAIVRAAYEIGKAMAN